MSHTTNKWSSIILVTGILFIAINLRVPFRGLRANGTKTYAKEITNCYN